PGIVISGASSDTPPIVITTAAPHGLQTGMQVTIYGVRGNTAANGAFTITVTGSSTFSLNGSTANGTWTSGGTVVPLISVDIKDPELTREWSWRQQYRLWQANREIFLYPENYVLPETRTDASSFFSDLENDLRQSNCDADAAEAALENYLRKLVGVARLHVAAHYNQMNSDGSSVLYVF